ncbi:MAG: DUF5683 domain-containing protein [Ignavibacterium sp.]|nr:DUF5683 domain-containing protein [Ignavibacterium sp.]
MIKLIKILFFIVLLTSNLFCQIDTNSIQIKEDTIFVMRKSPWGAVLRSAIIPGLGQVYNESYWKVPIIWGLAGWFIYNWNDLNNLYSNNNQLYRQTNQNIYKIRRNFYRKQRDLFTIYLGLLYFFNLVDAYVDAHLYDFQIDSNQINDLKINIVIRF